ncbi:hypothetical protein Zm00014a_003238 [Zea mays]|uniref:Uncharacterized protein n=1 Tax=Zea mays TaxID=4577 RepID=A0A3L6GCA0_MAIZE|nr:hypothetical protein Zm00014a_003238 [Zea mays]PWZ46184.1 hypothetical protein Zm00014a_003238 [Zea mays]
MERSEPSLKPEWLLRPTVPATTYKPATLPHTDDHGRGASSRNRSSGRDRDRSSQHSSSRRGSSSSGPRRNDRDGIGKSRGYGNFGKHNKERIQEKDLDFRDRESRLVQSDDPLRDGFESFSSCRSEKDRLNRTRSKVAISNRAVGVSLDNGNVSKKDNGVISFEREFPHLDSEDKNGKQDIGRVPSPGISTPIQNIPLLSIDAQKIEERTMRQCILRPLTPSSNKIPASSSLDKLLKSKGARAGESNGPIKVAPQLSTQPSSNSVRTPVKTELVKQSQSGSLQVLSREQNGAVNTAAKDSTSNPVSPVLGRSSSMEPMRKSIASPKLKVGTNGRSLHPLQGSFADRKASAKDKYKFFEMLRSKSVNGSSAAIESPSSLTDDQQNSNLDLPFKFIENGSSSCEEANSCEGSQRHLSDNETIPPSESHDVLDEGSLGIQVEDKDVSSSQVLGGTQDLSSKKPQEDNVNIVPIAPVYVNDGLMMPNSVDDEASLPLEETNPAEVLQHIGAGEENPCPAQEFESIGAGGEEELNLLRSMGWDENEDVQPLQQEEIADCLKQNVRLQQKLQECKG